MKIVYRVKIAVDYEGQRSRELFYTESKEEAKSHYIEAQKKINRFGEENGLKVYDLEHNECYKTIYADGESKYHPFKGAHAELSQNDCMSDDFLDLYNNDPIF